VIKKAVRPDWIVHSGVFDKEVQIMVTPRVVEEVRRHFNCSELDGAELEDQGEDGTALTHWEKRVFEVCEVSKSLKILIFISVGPLIISFKRYEIYAPNWAPGCTCHINPFG